MGKRRVVICLKIALNLNTKNHHFALPVFALYYNAKADKAKCLIELVCFQRIKKK